MRTITIITFQNVRNYGSVLAGFDDSKCLNHWDKVAFFNYIRSNNATPVEKS
jgi:hypothetical protein